jgi:hypothetical protein
MAAARSVVRRDDAEASGLWDASLAISAENNER